MNNTLNPLKDVFFPVKDDILFTVGRRTDEGVARGDACGIEHGKLCEALLCAGKDEDYHPMLVEGYQNTFVQMVSPESSKEDRANEQVGENFTVRDMNVISAGGIPNLDAMLSQHPTGLDYPYLVQSMRDARAISGRSNYIWGYPEATGMPHSYHANRAIPGRSNFAWGYPEAVEEQGINTSDGYTWQDMVSNKGATGPWQWTLLEVFPSGETREILKVGEVPGSLIHDAVLISVGKGINPYNPEKYLFMIFLKTL